MHTPTISTRFLFPSNHIKGFNNMDSTKFERVLVWLQWLGFASIAICISLGQISRWDLLEQIAGADRPPVSAIMSPYPTTT